MAMSKIKSRSHYDVAHLHPPPPTNVPSRRSFNFLYFTASEYSPDKILKAKVTTTTRSNESHTMMLHTYIPNQCTYSVYISYTLRFQRYSLDNALKVKVTAARSTQGHTMMLHTHYPQPMSLPSIDFLHLTVCEI